MSISEALNWRYAAKRMTGVKIPETKLDAILDAISLAPSSYGLQPYSVLVIENQDILEKIRPIAMNQPQITEASAILVFAVWDKLSVEKIDIYIDQMAKERNVTTESLGQFKDQMSAQLKNSDSDNFNWNSKQAYIALGVGLVAAAEEEIDSTPMEGFDKQALDDFLKLKEKGLQSSVLLALG
ncbi:MAG: nitroreductase family protein, partial [Chitinophagales bacterium]